MIFLSAGHHLGDSGAVSGQNKESQLTIELRELVDQELKAKNFQTIKDKDTETLSQYISRISKSVGTGSVVCELHFNAANGIASGVEVVYPDTAYHFTNFLVLSKQIAEGMSKEIAECLGLPNRGAKQEKNTARKNIAILRTGAGISILPEICFIDNKKDMAEYHQKKREVAKIIAKWLSQAEVMKS